MKDCAAIDMKGGIIIIPCTASENPSMLIKPQYLPDDEKAVSLVCGHDYFFALSSTGKLFVSERKRDNIKLVFKRVNEFKRTKIIQISGKDRHFLWLTEKGHVFVFGDNYYGQACIDSQKYFIDKFTEILTLRKYKNTNVYANSFNSFFFKQKMDKYLHVDQLMTKHSFWIQIQKKMNISMFLLKHQIKSGAVFCSTGGIGSAVLIGFDAYNVTQ